MRRGRLARRRELRLGGSRGRSYRARRGRGRGQRVRRRDDAELAVVEPAELRVDLDVQALGREALGVVELLAERLLLRRGGGRVATVQAGDESIRDRLVPAQPGGDQIRRQAVLRAGGRCPPA